MSDISAITLSLFPNITRPAVPGLGRIHLSVSICVLRCKFKSTFSIPY